jgi:hypothetical protein
VCHCQSCIAHPRTPHMVPPAEVIEDLKRTRARYLNMGCTYKSSDSCIRPSDPK